MQRYKVMVLEIIEETNFYDQGTDVKPREFEMEFVEIIDIQISG